jgi:outer membrane protein OmpA-like peptidoglycan-associated protein
LVDTGRAPAQAKAAEVPKVDPKVTKAWLDAYEPKLREAIKDSKFELERREDLLVITAPVDSSFNPDRPSMLLPVSLGPITRVAKAIDADHKTAVLVLGHADTSGAAPLNQKLSQERAQSIASIFRLSGLQRDRLMLRGMGSVMPRAANDSVEGRSLNRRVEILLTPQNTMLALLAKYNQPTFTAAEMLATQDIKAVPTPVVKAPAKAAPKKAAAKPAVAAKKKAAPAAKKADAKKAVAKKAASNDQAKAH